MKMYTKDLDMVKEELPDSVITVLDTIRSCSGEEIFEIEVLPSPTNVEDLCWVCLKPEELEELPNE